MKKLSLLLLLLSLLLHSFAQKVLFSNSFGNYSLAPVIKHISSTQYVGYIWHSPNGGFYYPYLFFLDKKGQKTRDDLSFNSGYILSSGFINGYRSGFLIENYEAPSGFGNQRVVSYLDASGEKIWKHEFTNVQTYYAYGPSLSVEPDKRLRFILADTNGKMAFYTLDSNGIELSNVNIKESIPSSYIAFNLIRVADNRYLFATVDNEVSHSRSSLLYTDSSGIVLWNLPFNDSLGTGLIEHAILLNNSIYVKT